MENSRLGTVTTTSIWEAERPIHSNRPTAVGNYHALAIDAPPVEPTREIPFY